MSALVDDWLRATAGNVPAAATNVARGLMRDDPETFKRGYTPDNAFLAVRDLFAQEGHPLGLAEQRDLARSIGAKPRDLEGERYYLALGNPLGPGNLVEVEVTREQWIAVERAAGFRGGGDGPATAGFSNGLVAGRVGHQVAGRIGPA